MDWARKILCVCLIIVKRTRLHVNRKKRLWLDEVKIDMVGLKPGSGDIGILSISRKREENCIINYHLFCIEFYYF